jgi:hypothetical protein
MPNMSYCRFENTVLALRDCLKTLNSGEREISGRDETEAARTLISMMIEFTEEVGEDLDIDEYVEERREKTRMEAGGE